MQMSQFLSANNQKIQTGLCLANKLGFSFVLYSCQVHTRRRLCIVPHFSPTYPPQHWKVKTNGKGPCFKLYMCLDSFFHQAGLRVLYLTSSSHYFNCPAFFYDLKRLQSFQRTDHWLFCASYFCVAALGPVGLLAEGQDRDRGGRQKFLAQELAEKVVEMKWVQSTPGSLFLEPQKASPENTTYLNTRNSVPDFFLRFPEFLWTCAKAGWNSVVVLVF